MWDFFLHAILLHSSAVWEKGVGSYLRLLHKSVQNENREVGQM